MNDQIPKYRSDIIQQSIQTEGMIDLIISLHYFKKISYSFNMEVLYDVNFTFALKRNILEKIDPNFSKYGEKLNRLNNIRNIFAHCSYSIFKEDDNIPRIYDPKNIKKELDFEKLYHEFITIEKDVSKELSNVFMSLGPGFTDT